MPDPHPIDIEAARRLFGAASPGPWQWFGNGQTHSLYLATPHSGRRYVMCFDRWGMRGAQPVFQKDSELVGAKDLLQFEVGDDSVVGMDQAKESPSVYRFDVRGIDHPDAEFIAAAREGWPAAVDEVERLRSLINECEEANLRGREEHGRLREALLNLVDLCDNGVLDEDCFAMVRARELLSPQEDKTDGK